MRDTDGTRAVLDELLGRVGAVLFDFDGPVCDLFAGRSTAGVAARIKRVAARHWGALDPEVAACDDSHGVLRPLREMYERRSPGPGGDRPLRRAEAIVARQERTAVRRAVAAPGSTELVRALHRGGMALAVASNNAAQPVRAYLERRGILGEFTAVCGRDPEDARRMKPHPDCVRRALAALDRCPGCCLLVGDQLTDLSAARAAGTRFLGYTADAARREEMLRAGADAVIGSHTVFLAAAEALAARRGQPVADSQSESNQARVRATKTVPCACGSSLVT
ncbi:HAD family hydrolase [Streptomyces fumanus]|uniref:HAD family hydrolase n=1 Tax=Streptomyces fumanus TaxID=67302 RepID=UPI00340652AE